MILESTTKTPGKIDIGPLKGKILDFNSRICSDKRAKNEDLSNQYDKARERESEIDQKISNEQFKLTGLKENLNDYRERKASKDIEKKKILFSLEE